MGQSYRQNSVESRLIKIEQEILKLKAIQFYDPQQVNYSYISNSVTVNSYNWIQNYTTQGIVASFIFTSWFPTIYPRVMFDFERTSGSTGSLIYERTERYSRNEARVIVQLTSSTVPFTNPDPFTINARVKSNVSGVLKLEGTYVLPS